MGFPSFSTTIIVLLALQATSAIAAKPKVLSSLQEGNSLRVDENNEFLSSPDGTFFAGFYEVGSNAFCFAIWFAKSRDKTVVWMANRDQPVNGKKSRISLQKNGNMVLVDASGLIVWSTGTFSHSVIETELLNTGNLVVRERDTKTSIWESFRYPTDTLLPLQPLIKNTTLVSMASKGSFMSGVYNLKFDDSNVLKLVYDGPRLSSIYWPKPLYVFQANRTPYNSSRVAVLDDLGGFLSSDDLAFEAYDYGPGPKRRLTLDYDGILRLYSLDEESGFWRVSWLPSGIDSCRVNGLCGEYGICKYTAEKPGCSCPFGFERRDVSDWSKGCEPAFSLSNRTADELGFSQLLNTDYYGYDLDTYKIGISFEACRNSCLFDTRCKGFGYAFDGYGQCFPKAYLVNGFKIPEIPSIIYLKVPKTLLSSSNRAESDALSCVGTRVVSKSYYDVAEKSHKDGYVKYLMGFVVSFGVIEAICLGMWWWLIYRKQVTEETLNMGYIALALGFKKFSYSELKRATKNFEEEVGKGGFGSVYKGIFDDGRVVAVKRLEGVLQGNSEFWAEVSVIGNINHRNLVKLWGFCAEYDHKLLVYEYVENSSLDKLLFSDSSPIKLGWKQRYNIALGTAKGLSYLHEECLEWVLHCDIKPQNILLDELLEAKVADFGMSKLFKDVRDVGFSRVRGTRGYLAPEWTMNLKIDAKADVYSYGVVLLELLSGQCVSSFEHLVPWMTEKIRRDGFEGVVDPRLFEAGFEGKRVEVERLVNVALLCVQQDRNLRPAMSKVVEILLQNYKPL